MKIAIYDGRDEFLGITRLYRFSPQVNEFEPESSGRHAFC